MHATHYAARYYDHLFNLSGGTLEVTSEKVKFLGSWIYLIRCYFRFDGKAYAWSIRIPEEAAELHFPWGHPDHMCVYQVARGLRDTLKTLKEQGVEHALLETWS